ncbi:hypothetical protein N7457_000561 [Penicillium paradoxum]|uniref:uncharacterized protein n=1 Tax=Penicillium paradoxum TaxID=176176 RepID=UPI0025471E1E|nr:uncharacterized protein N7457_000561 [Penicillium paradoxum]KAJ5793962.1 hypothetical protein N7457_000561 [Penicillium paradoxum]
MASIAIRCLNARLRASIITKGPGINSAYRLNSRASSAQTFQSRLCSTSGAFPTQEKPRSFPTTGFEVIKPDQPAEEEQLVGYKAHRYYPVHIGKVFQDRYQVCSKLGWGSCSTTWLARDLRFVGFNRLFKYPITDSRRDKKYVALKVHINDSMFHRELPFYQHIAPHMSSDHPGRENIRRFMDSFTVTGPDGKHIVLVQEPAHISLYDLLTERMSEARFPEEAVKLILVELLQALDFLHTECEAVHTDVHFGNLLACVDDARNAVFKNIEESEITTPSARKQVSSDRTIYASRALLPDEGPLKLSDFGEARIGPGPYEYHAMPMSQRAPEITLEAPWSYPIDIWSVGLTACDLLGLERLFSADHTAGDLYQATHLAEMIAVLGPPPAGFLALNPEIAAGYWDGDGKWGDIVPIPEKPMLESLEGQMGLPREFVGFLRRTLSWMPSERATAKDLLEDPWLKS